MKKEDWDKVNYLSESINPNTRRNEIFLANNVKDGYVRNFKIPTIYYGYDYSIEIFNNTMVLESQKSNIQHEYFIPSLNGTIKKGDNIIKKINGTIYLN